MADLKPQNQEKSASNLPASSAPQDYYSVLMKVINDVSNDHALLRKLVYALAWQNLRPEVIVTKPIPEAQSQAKTIAELGQALELEKAIERLEAEAVGQDLKQISKPRAFDNPERSEAAPQRKHEPRREPDPPPADDFNPAVLAAKIPLNDHPPEPEVAAIQLQDASFEPPRSVNPIAPVAEQRAWPERKDIVTLERIPTWLDPNVRVSLDSVEYAPIQRPPYQGRSGLASFAQLIAASVIGVVLYIGISGWVYLGRHPATAPGNPAAPPPPPVQQQAAASQPDGRQAANQVQGQVQGQSQQSVAMPPIEPQPILPFPLPRTYGIYAGTPGQLHELEALPIRVPDPRVLASAEITKPGRPPIPGDSLAFVVFRRDLVNSAPQTITVRVVARVERTTKFVNGKPSVVPVEGVWRVRSKAYEFKVSPLEGRNEMIVVQPNPGFVFPPGRYALVLNGLGYDFTVAGNVTAPEQCLEQVEIVSGSVLAECPKV
jgi:hypothetical protein